MSGTAITFRSWLILTHRTLGVALCLLFLVWFASGIVLMYCPFPAVEPENRLARAASLDPGRIHFTAGQALAALHVSSKPSELRLNLLDGRPVYRFVFGRGARLIFADDGQPLEAIPPQIALRIASAWTGFPPGAASLEGLVTNDDQWTFDSSVHPYGPFWKYSWPNGEAIYVSQTTGEVVQDTTRASRLGAYFGAIPHWLYFAPLRRRAALWNRLVVWLAGAGAATSVFGLVIGFWLYSPSRRYRFPKGPSSVPYRGPKRWHMSLGLIFGAVTFTWVFSGLLSMGPFSWLTQPESPNLDAALRGDSLDIGMFAAKDPRQAIAEAGVELRVKELEFASRDGAAVYLARETPRKSRIIALNGALKGGPREMFDCGQLLASVKRAVAPAGVIQHRLLNDYDLYYVSRWGRLPLPVLYIQLNDASQSAYYIDPRTAKVVQSYGVRSRWNRWLYHGLHSIDLPWLYARRPAWDILVIVLLLGGSALSVTSVWLAGRLVRRKLTTHFQPSGRG